MTSLYMPVCQSSFNSRDVMHSDLVRPNTPSFRIVNTPAVNPSPTFSEEFEEEEILFEDVLSPKKLRQLSGYSDLSKVISLDLVVDTTESSLGSLGNYLPNIRELRLSGSRVLSVRDLGTTLRSLEVLWMSRCGLQDLDGIGSIGNLKELYLSYNEISDVSPLSMVDTLELVDIESNSVDTIDQVEFLCMCPNLITLNLEGNPVTTSMTPVELRKKIAEILPDLVYLDDQPLKGKVTELTTSSHKLLGNTGNLQSEIKVVNSSLKDTLSEVARRPKSAKSDREEITTPSPTPSPGIFADHSSELTQGAVLCGPPSKLRNKISRKDSAPPTPVGAWSEDPDIMLEEWKTSRDWLTRELTIDCMQEEKYRSEKQANYEAALRESSRPSSRKLSRPTSAQRTPSARAGKGKSKTPAYYDESVEVEGRSRGKSRDRDVIRPPRSGSRDRSAKGKHREPKTNSTSSSAEFPRPRRSSVDKNYASSSLDSGLAPVSPLRAVLRPPNSPLSSKPKTLPTPPKAGKTMSNRFRRLKVSIEDQVTQQSTVDVLFNDRMPRPGLSRHALAVPKSSARSNS